MLTPAAALAWAADPFEDDGSDRCRVPGCRKRGSGGYRISGQAVRLCTDHRSLAVLVTLISDLDRDPLTRDQRSAKP